MHDKGLIKSVGTCVEQCGGGNYRIKLDNGDIEVLALLSGKIKLNKIKIITCDRVEVEISPYDLTRGRITRRLKQ